jgi:hypothetical protein
LFCLRPTCCLSSAAIFFSRAVRAQSVGEDRVRPAVPLQRFLEEYQRR